MKKICWLSWISILLITVTLTAKAEGLRFAVVNMNIILEKSPQMAKIYKVVEHKFQPQHTKIIELQKELQSEIDKLAEHTATMKTGERAALQMKIMTDRSNLQSMEADFKQDYSNQQDKILDSFSQQVENVIARLAANKHIDVVIKETGIWYAKPDLDITTEVLQALQSEAIVIM